MSFGSTINKTGPFVPVASKHRFEFVDKEYASSGNEAMKKYEWATTWGRACGGWMVFEDSATLEDWLRNG